MARCAGRPQANRPGGAEATVSLPPPRLAPATRIAPVWKARGPPIGWAYARAVDETAVPAVSPAPPVAAIAQSVERQVVVLDVTGSSPVGRPTPHFRPAAAAFRAAEGPLMSHSMGAAPLPPVFRHIAKHLPAWRPSVIFDVGANIGQSCTRYATAFPDAAIHAFEPVPSSFAALRERIGPFPNITAHPVALSWRAGQPRMTNLDTSVGNHILAPGSDASPGTPAGPRRGRRGLRGGTRDRRHLVPQDRHGRPRPRRAARLRPDDARG
jgi:hypothetical protein